MKKKNNHCPICKGEEVVYVNGKGKNGKLDGYYEVCECRLKEEPDMSGADGPNSGER